MSATASPDRSAASKWNPKTEAIRLWDADPCGGAVGANEGTPEFFRAVDRSRYDEYAPWLREAARFGRFPGAIVLEIGCGMGTDLAQFGRGGAVTMAVDLTPRHLAIAHKRLQCEGLIPRLARADAEQLPFRDAAVDVVYSFGVLHHTPGIEAAIREVHRVLKPGGTAIIALYHRNSAFYWISTLLIRGILQGQLFSRGYRRLIADVERHDHTDALPLVRVYSRRELKRLLSRFSSVETRVHHLGVSFGTRVFRYLPPSFVRWCDRRFGWYVIAYATK